MFMRLQKLKWSVTKNLLNHLQSEQVQTWLSVRSATVTQGVYTLQVKKQFLCSENIKKVFRILQKCQYFQLVTEDIFSLKHESIYKKNLRSIYIYLSMYYIFI